MYFYDCFKIPSVIHIFRVGGWVQVGEIGKKGQKVQTFSYKINKCLAYTLQHDDFCQYYCRIFLNLLRQ